jgi:signal transduction histidine kinase
VALSFVVGGLAWVLLSDIILYRWVHDPILLARLETAKGWAFIGLGAALMYAVTFRYGDRFVRAQALTAAIVESIGDGVLLLGTDRTIAYANPAAVEMLKSSQGADLLGMTASEFSRRFRVCYPDGSLVAPENYVSQRAFDQGGTLHYVAVLNPPGRPEIVISSTASAIRATDGPLPVQVVSVMHDITVSAHLEQLRNQFFAAAAHALKTPVAVIKANVQVLSQRFDAGLTRPMAAIERQCDRIDRLVQNLLVLSRAHSQSLRLYQRDVDLRPILEEVVRDATAAGIRHPLSIDVAGAPHAYADPERLAMAVRNLVDVAARSSVSGTPLAVTVRQPNRDAQIGIRYQPMPAAERPHDVVGEYDDIGISQCVAAMVAEAHGGSLVETNADPETTLWIRLPIGGDGHVQRA